MYNLKYALLSFFILFCATYSCAQSKIGSFKLKELRFGIDKKFKTDWYTKADDNADSGGSGWSDPLNNYCLNLGILFSNNLFFEAGYQKESFNISWEYEKEDVFRYFTEDIEHSFIVPIRLGYQLKLFKVFGQPVYLSPSIGYQMAFNRGTNNMQDWSGIMGRSGTEFFGTYAYKKGEEYALRKYNGFFEGRLQIEATVSKVFSFYAGGGYCRGQHIIGRTDVSYSYQNGPEQRIATTTRGSNKYVNIGIRLRIPLMEK